MLHLQEYDKPSRLLNSIHSHFYKMVRDAGKEVNEQMALISTEVWKQFLSNKITEFELCHKYFSPYYRIQDSEI